MTAGAFDFLDPAFHAGVGAHETWRLLRASDPVHFHEFRGRGAWLLTKHQHVVQASRDGETFLSNRGVGLPGFQDDVVPPTLRLQSSPGGERMLNYLDPPEHGRMRKIIARAFTPRTLERLEPAIREITNQVLASIRPKERADFATEIATRIPVLVLCSFLGIPQDDWQRIVTWTHEMEPSDEADYQREGETAAFTREVAFNELVRYLRELIEANRKNAKVGLVGDLCTAEEDGRLSDGEILWFCILLVNAGHETVRNALSGGLLAFLEHPAELEKLKSHPELVDLSIEEIFRWTSPIIYFSRFVAHDVEIGGKAIRAGQRVFLLFTSANRDEEVFADPFRFDAGRSPNDHLAFGIGHHFCLGASLARMELRVALPAVLERLPSLALDGEPRRLRSFFNAGITHLPVRWSSR
jgi:cholest-4-en-3-one 26-monooxygenase